MNDQAEALRRRVQLSESKEATVIAVASGKGGVGKSNVCLNLAIALAQHGKRVAIFDLDFGMANVDILMGVSPRFHLIDMLESRLTIWDILEKGPGGISYFAGGSGFTGFIHLNESKLNRFFGQMEAISSRYDFIFLDMGAGATEESMKLILAAHEVFIVTTPEPTAMTDAYSMIKYIHLRDQKKPMFVIVNRAESDQEGRHTIENLQRVAKQFLQKVLTPLGVLPYDQAVSKAVKAQTPFVLYDNKAQASAAMFELARSYLGLERSSESRAASFIARVRTFF